MLSTPRRVIVTSRCRKKLQVSLLRRHSPGKLRQPRQSHLLQQHLPLKQHPAEAARDNALQDRRDAVTIAVVHGAVTIIAILIDMIVDIAGGAVTGTTAGVCLLAAGTAARGIAEAEAAATAGVCLLAAGTAARGIAEEEAAAGARPGAVTGVGAAGGGDSMLIRNRVIYSEGE
jgi:hypothetical protein